MKRRLSSTDVRKTMRPGEPGTRRHLRDWGERLVCVRHRVDPTRGLRFTTVEIVASSKRLARPRREPHPEALVYARVGRDEWELERRLRTTKSATYDPDLNVWRMRYETAVRLRLKRRLLFKRPERRAGFAPRNAAPSNPNIPAHADSNIPSHPCPNSGEFE
jgi:hypothetical protein